MGQRLDLHQILVSVLGSNNVYFQPPPTIQMVYPCVIYKRDDVDVKHANNETYSKTKRYQVTVIDRDPDSEVPDRVLELPRCTYDRFYTADNLNHDVFKLYF